MNQTEPPDDDHAVAKAFVLILLATAGGAGYGFVLAETRHAAADPAGACVSDRVVACSRAVP